MTPGALPREAIEPLGSTRLRARFPRLSEAMSLELMTGRLQQLILRGAAVHSCERPKAELSADRCSLQYPLRVGTASGEGDRLLVLATMFGDATAAAAHESSTLRAVAAGAPRSWHAPVRLTAFDPDLCLALSVFPVNGSIPTLVRATDPAFMTPLLRRALGEKTAKVTAVDLVVFRRTRGCVLRYTVDSRSRSTLYAKVGYSSLDEDVVSLTLEALAAAAGEQRSPLRFPSVIGRDRGLELSLTTEVAGLRADPAVSAEAERLVVAAACAAATLHRSGMRAGKVRTLQEEVDRAERSVELIREYAPLLARSLSEPLRRLRKNRMAHAPDVVLSHGDFTPSQLLFDGELVGVLDFDKLCQAEPALDLGRFLAYLRFKLAKAGARDVEARTAQFLDCYRRFGGEPGALERIRAFQLVNLVRMAARSWLQLKPARLSVVLGVLEKLI